ANRALQTAIVASGAVITLGALTFNIRGGAYDVKLDPNAKLGAKIEAKDGITLNLKDAKVDVPVERGNAVAKTDGSVGAGNDSTSVAAVDALTKALNAYTDGVLKDKSSAGQIAALLQKNIALQQKLAERKES